MEGTASSASVPARNEGRTLTARTVNGFFWTFGGAIGQAVLRLAILAILARILTPTDFGIVSAALTVVALAEIFGQMGVAPAIIQAATLNPTDIRTGFTVSIAFGLAVAALMFTGSGLIAELFRIAEIEPVIRALSVIFLVRGFAVVSEALLMRELRFRTISAALLVNYALSYGVVAIVLAFAGFGLWSLVWAQILQSLLLSITYMYCARHPMIPVLNGQSLVKLGRFSVGETLARFGNYFAINADQVIVGRWLGAEILGFYSRAYVLMQQPVNLFGTIGDKVLFPALSSIQDDHKRSSRAYYRSMAMIALMTLPLTGILILLAPELIMLIMGPKWSAIVLPLQLMLPSLFFRTAYKITATFMRAQGAIYWLAWWQWIYAGEMVLGVWLGQFYGLTGVCTSLGIVFFVNFWLGQLIARQTCALPILPVFGILLRYGAVALATVIPLFLLKMHFTSLHPHPLATVILSGVVTGLCALIVWASAPRILGEDGLWIRSVTSGKWSRTAVPASSP